MNGHLCVLNHESFGFLALPRMQNRSHLMFHHEDNAVKPRPLSIQAQARKDSTSRNPFPNHGHASTLYFLAGNLGWPILSPRRMTLSARSILPSSC